MLTPALLYHTVTLCPLSAPHPTHLPHSPVPSWAVPYVSATESKQCPQEWHTEALGAAISICTAAAPSKNNPLQCNHVHRLLRVQHGELGCYEAAA